jgi:hypothetical protein
MKKKTSKYTQKPYLRLGPAQVHVAEEDFPYAEELLLRAKAQE